MKKLFFAAIAALTTVFGVNAQVQVQSPHPDLDVKVTRCAYASGTVVVDMVITNFGPDVELDFQATDGECNSTAYDDDGNQYTKGMSLGLTSNGLSGYRSYVTLPQDIPLKFRVQLKDVSVNATKLSLLKINMGVRSGVMDLGGKPLQIRNIEWIK